MPDVIISDAEFVARAIFLPAMLDSNGNVSLAAFTLMHDLTADELISRISGSATVNIQAGD